jgi:Zn-dependent protease
MVVLLAHELGHYFAFRAYGLPVKLPAFIPLLGAFTAGVAPEDLEQDAYIALAGPLTGLGLASVCYAIALQTNDRFWFACADVSAFLNLFNMIPMPPFDGGRVIGALWPPLWFVGFGLFVIFSIVFHLPLFFVALIGILGLPSMIASWKGKIDPRAARMTFPARLRVSVWYLVTLTGLFFVMSQAHAMGTPAARGGLAW